MFGFPAEVRLRLARMNNPTEAVNLAAIEVGGKTHMGEAEYRVIQRLDVVSGILTFLERCDTQEPFLTMVWYNTPVDVSISCDTSKFTPERARDIFLHLQGIYDRHHLPMLDLDHQDPIVQGLNMFTISDRKITEDTVDITFDVKCLVDKFSLHITRVKDETAGQTPAANGSQDSAAAAR